MIRNNNNKKMRGFTLLEVLIALFIFTILSMILVGALHTIIGAQSGTEASAVRLRNVELALLLISRDVDQSVNRPIVSANGREEAAFRGTPRQFEFTQMGIANPTQVARSTMQRTGYIFSEGVLSRFTFTALDQAPDARPHMRKLLSLPEASFQYLANDGRFYDKWPAEGKSNEPLPRAVRMMLTLPNWGKLSQLYVLRSESSKANQTPAPKQEQGQEQEHGQDQES